MSTFGEPPLAQRANHAPQPSQPSQHAYRQPRCTPPPLPPEVYFEPQQKRFCLCHALNMLLGYCALTGDHLVSWCQQQEALATPAAKSLWSASYNFDGHFSTGVIAFWLWHHGHGLTPTTVLSRDPHAQATPLTPAILTALLDNLSHQHPNQTIRGFLLQSQEPYEHASALIKHNGTWLWLDSEKPSRALLSHDPSHDVNHNWRTLNTVTTHLLALTPAMSLDDTSAFPFRPRDQNNAAPEVVDIDADPCIPPRKRPASPPVPSTHNRPCCSFHLVNQLSLQ